MTQDRGQSGEGRVDGLHPDEGMAFLTGLARELHAAGTPAHRMEDIVTLLAGRLGYEAESFVLPTGIFISCGREGQQRVSLQRVRPGEINLARQCALDEIANGVMHGQVPISVGRARLAQLAGDCRAWPAPLSVLAMALVSGGVVTFFNGGLAEALLSTGIGALVGLISLVAGRSEALGRVFLLFSACLATIMATLAGAWWGGLSVYVCIISSLIVLIPGLTLTTAVNELATGHLAAGTARFFGAMVVLLQIGFGVVLGTGIMQAFQIQAAVVEPEPLVAWIRWLGVVVTSLAFVVIFQARGRDTHLMLLAGLLAYGTTSLGMSHLDNLLGASLAALAVGSAANLYARLTDRPAALIRVPGVIILVPGALGFHSISKLLEQDVTSGLQAGFGMIMVAISIVAGLAVSSFLIHPRKAL